jgi:uncharacterized RDD family membrane protein YckC
MAGVNFRTAQNVQIDLNTASLGDRILAYLIDSLIILGYFALVFTVGVSFEGIQNVNNIGIGVVILVLVLPSFLYHLLCEIFFNGQSLGKRQIKIRVVRLDGDQPGIGAYLLRWLLRPIDLWFYGIVGVLMIALGGKGQRLGDFAAGTTVIKLKNGRDLSSSDLIIKQDDTYQVSFPEASKLTDEDIQLIKEVLTVFSDTANREPVIKLAEKLKGVLNINTNLPEVRFLYTLVKDYEYLAVTK